MAELTRGQKAAQTRAKNKAAKQEKERAEKERVEKEVAALMSENEGRYDFAHEIDLMSAASDLLADGEGHPEYVRAVVELTTRHVGQPMENAWLVAAALGVRDFTPFDY